MAVIETGAIYKSLTFDGEDSRKYGVYITGQAVYNAPAREVEMVSIPGRNGQLALDKGRFENIEVTYPAGVFADNEADFAEAISNFRNFLCSRRGYVRLTDDYNPNEYRMAVYKSGLEVSPATLTAGEFEIVFDCKPQRWLTEGEEAVTIGEWGETETVTGDIVEIVDEKGIDAVKSLEVSLSPIQDLNGYDAPWGGGAGKNLLDNQLFNGVSSSGLKYTPKDNGKIQVSGTVLTASWLNLSAVVQLSDMRMAEGDTLVISSGIRASCQFRDASDSVLSSIDTMAYRSGTIPSGTTNLRFYLYASTSVGVVGETINEELWVQLEKGSTATAWTPYSNICPISGRTEVDVVRTGKNLFDKNAASAGKWLNTTTGLEEDSGNYVVSDYIPVEKGESVFIPNSATVRRWFYDAQKQPKVYLSKSGDQSFTPTENGFIRVSILAKGTDAINLDTYQIEYGSTATEYEPYQGETYHTDLGRTVYGGTLDVVSGELVVDKAIVTLNGSSTWVAQGTLTNTKHYSHDINDITASTGVYSDDVIGDSMPTIASNVDSVHMNHRNVAVHVWIPKDITPSAYFADKPLQVCYPLATPQTYQLTPTQISLLQGENNVWSEDGEVTVVYGQNPNVLLNPTLFESSPLLMVEGYGDIGFNGYSIDIENAVMGKLVLADTFSGDKQYASIFFDKELLNNGDTITLEDFAFKWYVEASGGLIERVTSIAHSNSKFATTHSGTISAFHPALTEAQPITFEAGTDSVESDTMTVSCVRGAVTMTIIVKTTISYTYDQTTGSSRIDISVWEGPSDPDTFIFIMRRLSYSQVEGDSTVSILGHPTYIDCDYGEAYMIKGATPISLNAYIDLGSDLPKLATGKNEITHDDTITELKIAPRWWKI